MVEPAFLFAKPSLVVQMVVMAEVLMATVLPVVAVVPLASRALRVLTLVAVPVAMVSFHLLRVVL
jgi:hypothetical protein